jgi:hypothetical protein
MAYDADDQHTTTPLLREQLELLLAECPLCGGDGLALDQELLASGLDTFDCYVPCVLCSPLRDALAYVDANQETA